MRVWLNSLEETARDFHGLRPQEFCSRAYEHATDYWIKIMRSELGIIIPDTDSPRTAIENYIYSGVKGGLFNDAQEFELEELPSMGIIVTVHQCPYQDSCRDLLDKGFSLKSLTCARLGCFRAACLLLAHQECSYELHEVRPGIGCKGVIDPI